MTVGIQLIHTAVEETSLKFVLPGRRAVDQMKELHLIGIDGQGRAVSIDCSAVNSNMLFLPLCVLRNAARRSRE